MARRIDSEDDLRDGEVSSICAWCWHTVAVGLDDVSWGPVAPKCDDCASEHVAQVLTADQVQELRARLEAERRETDT